MVGTFGDVEINCNVTVYCHVVAADEFHSFWSFYIRPDIICARFHAAEPVGARFFVKESHVVCVRSAVDSGVKSSSYKKWILFGIFRRIIFEVDGHVITFGLVGARCPLCFVSCYSFIAGESVCSVDSFFPLRHSVDDFLITCRNFKLLHDRLECVSRNCGCESKQRRNGVAK